MLSAFQGCDAQMAQGDARRGRCLASCRQRRVPRRCPALRLAVSLSLSVSLLDRRIVRRDGSLAGLMA